MRIPILLAVALTVVSAASAEAQVAPIRVLHLSDYSSDRHGPSYAYQARQLEEALAERAHAVFTRIGKRDEDSLQTLAQEGFAADYDAVLYDFCFPEEDDLALIDNVMRQTQDAGVPTVLVHCAVDSFRDSDWWQLTGVRTQTRRRRYNIDVELVADHPITRGLPASWTTGRDDLYGTFAVSEDVVPLAVAETGDLVAWTHQAGAGRVFGTALGRDRSTRTLDAFRDLLARGLLWATGHLADDGEAEVGYAGNQVYRNYQDTVQCFPGSVIEATNIEEVQEAMLRADAAGLAVKVVSLPTSNSNSGVICPEPGGMLLNLWQMNQLLSVDEEGLTATVQPGIRLHYLSLALAERGLAITTMPDYTGVSVAGAMATAAHNSSLQFANSVADLVESMTLVDAQGELHVFSGDELDLAAVHVGLLGVVVEVTLKVVPQYKLRYGHVAGRDNGLEDRIEEMVREHDYAKVMWFAGNGRYVLDYYDEVPLETRGESRHNIWSSTGAIFDVVGGLPYDILNNWPLRAQCDSALIRSKVWLAPIKAVSSPGSAPLGYSHKMLASYCEPGTCPWDNDEVKSRTMEVAFPVAHLQEWMADVRAILDERRGCFPVLGLYLRFSAASNRALGFNYGQDTVSFEIHVPKIVEETGHERSSDVYDEIVRVTLDRYAGRPHWGKNSLPAFLDLGSEQYPRWNDFLALKDQLDPNRRFENPFFRQVLQGGADAGPYAGCGLERSCWCETDLDCGTGYRCEAGGFDPDVRVCR